MVLRTNFTLSFPAARMKKEYLFSCVIVLVPVPGDVELFQELFLRVLSSEDRGMQWQVS